ncbi:alpha/beta fold hydrolase [Taibaiella koreensis]|uniref:alpha/beta fold hydrolase n=1 Tax=Taibaiella koreensis TaxID=1268548 RepID=UPI000E59E28E|nr:alpha/beta hydrolase [Taibaiella koreensis]
MKDLILLHGALGHTQQFDPYLSVLQQHFHVHTFLFAGHGGSAIPGRDLCMTDYIDQLEQFCKEKQLQTFDVFGYSMGGYVALGYALRHPGQITSLLTLATKLQWTVEGATRESQMLQPDKIAEKVPKYAAQLAAWHGEEEWKVLLPAIAGMMNDLGAHPLLGSHNYPDIQTRVQLMVGDKDAMVSREETMEATGLIPGARLAILPDTKHPLEQVRPGLLLALMKDFWNL